MRPGFNNLDFRISRDVPIHESIKLQFTGEAFNLLNHRIITGVNSTYSHTRAASASATCTRQSSAGAGWIAAAGLHRSVYCNGSQRLRRSVQHQQHALRSASASGLREAVLLNVTCSPTQSGSGHPEPL